MKNTLCPNINDKNYQRLIKEVGEDSAYKIWLDNGQKIPTGENLDAFIKRENTQQSKLANLQKSDSRKDTLEKLSNPDVEKSPDNKFYTNKTTGEVVSKRVSMLVDDYYRSQGVYFKSDNKFYAHKGTVVHEYISEIINRINKNEPVNLQNVYNEVRRLKQLDEFKEYDDADLKTSFFGMTGAQFKQLEDGVRSLLKDINDLQKTIDPKGEVKLFSEVIVYDEYRDVAGTIDLLAVFSDGSASMYDFKTFKSQKNESPGTVKIEAWDVQLSNYRNMLKDNYGINHFRHTRAIPIRTSYAKKDATTGKWINEITSGFQSIGIKTHKNNLEGLDPIPFRESLGDEKIDRLINSLEDKIQTLNNKISYEHDVSKRFSMKRQRKRLQKALKDMELGKDINSLLSYLRNIASKTRKQFNKAVQGDEGLHSGDLVDMYTELKIYEDLVLNFSNQLKNYKNEERAELEIKLQNAQQYIKDLMFDINKEIIDSVGGDDILKEGHLPANDLSRLIYGLGNWNQPVFQKLLLTWRDANQMKINQSHQDLDLISEKDDAFSEWAKKNGLSQSNKFSVLLNDKKELHNKHTRDFYTKKNDLRQKAAKGNLTKKDKEWLSKYFKFDSKAFEEDRKEMISNMKYSAEIGEISQKQLERNIKKFNKFSNPNTNNDNYYRRRNFKYFIPKENNKEYINKDWQYIQDNKPVKEYYDMLVDFNKKWSELIGHKNLGSNFVPNVHQNLTDHVLEHGKKNFKEVFLKKYQIRSNDSFAGRVDSEGNQLQSIPLLHVDRLIHKLSDDSNIRKRIEDDVTQLYQRNTKEFKDEVEKRVRDKEYEMGLDAKSTDLTKSFMLMADSVNEFVHLSQIEPTIKALKFLVDTDQVLEKAVGPTGKNLINRFTGGIIKKMGLSPDIKEAFETFTNRLIYKQKYKKELFGGENYSGNKVITDLMNWLSVRALGFNVVISGANFIQGKTNIWMTAKEGRYFDKSELKSIHEAFSRQDEQFANVVQFFEPASRDIVRERIELSGATAVSRRMRTRTFFLGHIKGDDHVDNSVLSAMSKRYRVDSDGVIKNPKYDTLIDENAPTVYDSVKYDEDTNKLYIPGLSVTEMTKFKAKVQKQLYKIKGTMTEEHKGVYGSSMLMSMFMQFRSWSGGLAEQRFGELKYDATMEDFEIGRFNAALGGILGNGALPALRETIALLSEVSFMGLYKREPNMERIKIKFDKFLRDNPEYKGQLNIDQYQELIKDKMNGFLAEARIYLSLIVLTQILAGFDWDDEEESNLLTWNAYQITRRSLLEVSFWFNPRSVDEIVRSPLPLWGLLREVERITDSSIREVTYQIKGERPKDIKAPFYYILKGTPGVNQVLSFGKYFEQYKPPKTWTDHVFSIWEDEE